EAPALAPAGLNGNAKAFVGLATLVHTTRNPSGIRARHATLVVYYVAYNLQAAGVSSAIRLIGKLPKPGSTELIDQILRRRQSYGSLAGYRATDVEVHRG